MEMSVNWLSENVPISFATALAAILLAIIYYYVANRNLPPGPMGLPFLGYWPFLSEENCSSKMDIFRQKYGDFYCFSYMGHLYLSLGSHKAVREAHVTKSEYFGGRFEKYSLLNTTFGDGLFMNGEGWRVLRKFFLQSFKERGMLSAKENISSSLEDAIHSTVAELKKREKGNPVDVLVLLTDKCTSILRRTLFGEDGVTDDMITEINEHYLALKKCMTATNLLLAGNFARYFILPFTPGYRKFKKNQAMIEKILYKIIDEHRVTYKEDHIRDVIDEYIKAANDRCLKGDPTARHFTDKALVSILVQFIGDGVLAVSASVAVFVKILLDHPEEQDKIYKEIVEVVGLDRLPTAEDKGKLVYTNAFLNEGLRSLDFFPFIPSMQCTKEVTIRGCRIPVGTITLLNFKSAHSDPNEYDEPEKFDPSRFLDTKDGKKRPELPINFGIGKRSCIGEGYAMLQIFLFLTSLIQNFRISSLNEKEKTTIELMFSGKWKILVEPIS